MTGWRSAWTAARDALARPGLWPIALAGFLARGGLALFVAPIIVPPSLVGLATFIGPASITPTGPTAGLIVRIAVATGLGAAALVAGITIAAGAEIALIGLSPGESRQPSGRLLRRIVLIRLVSLLPLAVSLAVGVQRLGQIVYLELTLPTDLVTPIVIRVAAQAPEIVAGIILTWLLGETWGGLATRLAVLRGAGVGPALLGGLGLLARRMPTVLVLLGVSLIVAAGVLAGAIALIAWSWDLVRDALLGGVGFGAIPIAIAATLVFAACWLLALVAAGALGAWRAVAWTLLVGEDHRGSGGTDPGRATL